MTETNISRMEYSIWFVPEEGSEKRQLLDEIIKRLADRFAAPVFVPHVTLIADLKGTEKAVIDGTKQLAKLISSQSLAFSLFDYSSQLFQTLVLRAVLTQGLVDANKSARDIFDGHSLPLFNPHMSLVYKEGIKNELKQQLINELKVGGLVPLPDSPLVVPVKALYIYTSPKPDNIPAWQEVGKFPLTGTK